MTQTKLGAGLSAAARGKTHNGKAAARPRREPPATVLIGGHYKPTVRRALLMIQAKQEVPRSLRQLLGEAMNDLCVKYGVPQAYEGEE